VSDTVTVASKPSGTLATIMPMRKTTFPTRSPFSTIPIMKNDTPSVKAMMLTFSTKSLISFAIGVSSLSVLDASCAVRPMNVSSPVAMTMPCPLPLTMSVPKKHRFGLSAGVSFDGFQSRLSASDSPVSDELSTSISGVHCTTRRSAGSAIPVVSSQMSPGTSCEGCSVSRFPSRVTTTSFGFILDSEPIRSALFDSW